MAQLNFVILDVFTTQPYTGNPLGVVFLPNEDERALTQSQKQRIASEFNLSETIFVHPESDAEEGQDGRSKRKIDIFTIDCELPFAGHPTVGAASWLLCLSPNREKERPVGTLVTKSGDISIRRLGEQNNTEVAARIAHNVRIHAARFPLKEVLRMHPTLAAFFPSGEQEQREISFPIVSIVNGMTQVHIELPSVAALAAVTVTGASMNDAAKPDYLDQGWQSGLVLAYFFVRDVDDAQTRKRVIRTRSIVGNFEDPATGSAASGLAAYLTLVEGKPRTYRYNIVQGTEMGRRSDIGIETVVKEKGKIDSIELTGVAVRVSEGRILVPE